MKSRQLDTIKDVCVDVDWYNSVCSPVIYVNKMFLYNIKRLNTPVFRFTLAILDTVQTKANYGYPEHFAQ